jgi:hypothetical protein
VLDPRRGPGGDPGLGLPVGDFARFRRGDFALMRWRHDSRRHTGVIRGALSLIVDPDRVSPDAVGARSGRSGETYAFDEQGLLISRAGLTPSLRSASPRTGKTQSALTVRLADPGVDFPNRLLR